MTTAFAATDTPPPAKSSRSFELVPKAFQKNPVLDITVLSEQTEAGRARQPVSISEPEYYVLQSAGYQLRGETIKQQPYPSSEVERILLRALRASGYLPATNEHPPTVVIVYMWGSHNVITPGNAVSPDLVVRNILDRAALVGGDKFARDLSKAFKESAQIAESTAPALGVAMGAADQGATTDLGAAAALHQIADMTDPVRMFKQRSPKNDFLLSQATSNCYFVIATAFDYASLATDNRQQLWRTRLTVTSDGITQSDAIPTLITVAAPYFGKDMKETEILQKPAVPKGSVEVGAPKVVEQPSPKSDGAK